MYTIAHEKDQVITRPNIDPKTTAPATNQIGENGQPQLMAVHVHQNEGHRFSVNVNIHSFKKDIAVPHDTVIQIVQWQSLPDGRQSARTREKVNIVEGTVTIIMFISVFQLIILPDIVNVKAINVKATGKPTYTNTTSVRHIQYIYQTLKY